MIDVVIQAGHEGGHRNGNKKSTGTSGEQARNTKVADRATEVLRSHGFTIERVGGVYKQKYDCKLAVSIHFDGSNTPCASGASIGYPVGKPAGSNKPTADLWRKIYSEYIPFNFMRDNFTKNLSGYYGYAYTSTEIAEVLLELGELTCPEDRAWLDTRIENGFLGDLIAYWAAMVLGKPIPAPKGETEKEIIAALQAVIRAQQTELEQQENTLRVIAGHANEIIKLT